MGGKKSLVELTKEEALVFLERMAGIVEAQLELEKDIPDLFCGLETKRKIFIFSDEAFYHLIDLFGRVISFDSSWCGENDFDTTRAEFEMELLGKTYIVFCLLDSGKGGV